MASLTFDFRRTQEKGAAASTEKKKEIKLNGRRWKLERERRGLFIKVPKAPVVLRLLFYPGFIGEEDSDRESSSRSVSSLFLFFCMVLGFGLDFGPIWAGMLHSPPFK